MTQARPWPAGGQHLSSVSAHKRYNTLHFACKVVCHETVSFFGFFLRCRGGAPEGAKTHSYCIGGFLLFGISVEIILNNADNVSGAHIQRHLEALVAADHITSLAIPGNRINEAKLRDETLELFVSLVTGFEGFPRIVRCWVQPDDGSFLNIYILHFE